MSLRLIEMIIPEARVERVPPLLENMPTHGYWEEPLAGEVALIRLLINAEDVEAAMDALKREFGGNEEFRLMLLAVEATLPRPQEPEKPQPSEEEREVKRKAAERISREELFASVSAGAKLGKIYIVTVVLSTIVAATGLMRNDEAIVIGAMVIAPLLGPNMALALGSTLGDLPLVKKAIRTNFYGLGLALGLSILSGLLLPYDTSTPAIVGRTEVGIGSVILALASGIAGAISMTSGAGAALIGVMVAVALLPPTVVFGVCIATGQWDNAVGAGLLLATNVVCVNVASIATFLAQGVRPGKWWETERAKRSTKIALTVWLSLLVILVLLILLRLFT